MYNYQLEAKTPRIVFRGTFNDVVEYLSETQEG